MKKPYIIAEAGVNYYDTAVEHGNTPLGEAKLYALEAKKAGVDAIKFQTYKADKIASKNSPAYWDQSKESTSSQYELFKKYDSFDEKDYQEISDYCSQIGIDFISTPFDYDSADFLDKMMKVYKISSSDLNNYPFLKYVAQKGKPVILSVGASYLSEVDKAVRILTDNNCPKISLLHCVLSYPCKYEDANLNVISYLKTVYPDITIGYSDHTQPDHSMTVLTTAFILGAEIIEKHFTLNKNLPGNDHYHAADPDDFKIFLDNVKRIMTITGEPQKTVLKCEEVSRKQARRSLVLTRDVKKGEILDKNDITAKRPGTGIQPEDANLIIGRTLLRDVKQDTALSWQDI